MAKRPTEEDLDLGPTPEEVEALKQPAAVEDDAPITAEEDDIHQIAAPRAEEPAKVVVAEDPVTGKFVGKDKAEQDKPGPETGKQPDNRTVDLRALQEERAARRELEGRMNTLLEVINKRESRAAKAEEPPTIPDKNVDPLAYMEYMEGRLGKIEGETAKQAEARQAQERENAQYQEVLAVAVPQFNEATKADPTLPQLQGALLESFARELAYNNGIPLDAATPQQRQFLEAELGKVERAHIAAAVSRGINVAEYMRGLAQSRGVAVKAPETMVTAGKPAARSIPERQAAQQRHMSIGDLPGSAAPSSLSAKDLAKMTPKEFAAFAKKLGDDGMDQLFQEA